MTRLALLVALAASLTLSGCVVIKSQSSSQLDGIGSVQITTTVCASDAAPSTHPGCGDADVEGGDGNGNSNQDAASDGARKTQGFIGYRVPAGSSGPDSFTSVAGGPLTFRRSSSYSSELQRLRPAPAGSQWIGYVSDPVDYDDPAPGAPATETTVAPRFSLPPGSGGAPFQGPFRYRTVVGGRLVDSGNVGDPVSCGSDLFTTSATATEERICIDSPAPAAVDSSLEQTTRDLAVQGGVPVTAAAGSTAVPGFVARFAGPAGPAFALSASSTVPGSQATLGSTSLSPSSDSTNVIGVAVPIPASTPPGPYEVRLTASGGQARSGSVPLTVTAPPPSKRLAFDKRTRVSVLTGHVRMRPDGTIVFRLSNRNPFGVSGTLAVRTAGAVQVNAAARRRSRRVRVKLGSATLRLPALSSTMVKVRLSARNRRLVRRVRNLAGRVTVTVRDPVGTRRTVRRRIRILAPRSKKKRRR